MHSEHWYQGVKLLHIASIAPQECLCGRIAGNQDLSFELANSFALSQDVKQSRFA